jgi:hypothetical protein
MATAGDKLFQKVTKMVVPVAKLQRRVPLTSNKLTPFTAFNRDILQGMKVTSVSMDDCANSQNFVKNVVADGGGLYQEGSGGKVDAIVCDARSIRSLDNLQLLHTKLSPIIRSLASNGRFVLIGGSDGSKPTPVSAGITAGLGGFTKALGKEVAGKGEIRILIYIPVYDATSE